ncbi:excinuclease ABC subunit UvrC [Candidatus Saccharibacteria bacterium]|nr:excinuclease ABC subunit UvrC [Candidatus Saccharibacteria bacterium]
MSDKLKKKLAKLPVVPGVYFFKNAGGEIIYIGKAANLRNRVRQYFHARPSASRRVADAKTAALVKEIADIDWIEVETEVDALFIEAEMVRRYMPSYNILLRDDKSLLYIRIDYKSDYPTVSFTRRPLDDGAQYFGPYVSSWEVKKALRYLRRAFPYATARPLSQAANRRRVSLHYHLGLDPGLEEGRTSLAAYRANLRRLMKYLRGQRTALTCEIERDMKHAAKTRDFEQAAKLRNQLFTLQSLNRQVIFSDREMLDASKDQALIEITKLLGLDKPPKRVEGFDISHIQGTHNVASMVVFINGVPCKTDYRKFKMRLAGNDDFAHMQEVVTRRLRDPNRKKWGLPDLILIDGGKGQLSAAMTARDQAGFPQIPMIGLAKREEEIIIRQPADEIESRKSPIRQAQGKKVERFEVISLPENSHLVKLLQRIRDEAHRFAVSYHTTLRQKRQTASLLENIPGVGPATRQKLIRQFGSARAVVNASADQLQRVLGVKTATTIAKFLSQLK